MKPKKILENLHKGKSVLVTEDIIQYLKDANIAFERVCTNFSHNSSLCSGKHLVNSGGKRLKSKSIKTEIRLI